MALNNAQGLKAIGSAVGTLTWHYAVGTFTHPSYNLKLYVDGVYKSQNTHVNKLQSTQSVRIGRASYWRRIISMALLMK